MFAIIANATAVVPTLNVAVVLPAGTITVAGTVADELSLDSWTTAPPCGAAPSSVTVPAEEVAPITVVGFNETDRTEGGLMIRMPVSTPL